MDLPKYRSCNYSGVYNCVSIVAQYIEPNPWVYTRLSGVSRVFYQVFTSDLRWQYLNPHGWERNIYAQFIEHCVHEHGQIRQYWSDKRRTDTKLRKLALERRGTPPNCAYLELGFIIYTILGPNITGEFQHNYSITSRQMLWCAVHITPYAFELATSGGIVDLTRDREIVEYVVQRTGDVYWNIHQDLQREREIVNKAIRHRIIMRFPGTWEHVCPALSSAPEYFKHDRDIVTTAVKHNREALQYASSELRGDKQIALTAIAADRAVPTESEDGEFRLTIHRLSPSLLEVVSLQLRDDFDVVLMAVKQDGMELRYASDRLKDNPDIVVAAVRSSQDAYNHSSLRMQASPEIMQAFHDHESFHHRTNF